MNEPVHFLLVGDKYLVSLHVSSVLMVLKKNVTLLTTGDKGKCTLACENFQDQYGTRRKEWQMEPTTSFTKALGLNPP